MTDDQIASLLDSKIEDDLLRGEPLMTLRRVTYLPWWPRRSDGSRMSANYFVAACKAIHDAPKPEMVEYAGKLLTTPSAVARWFRAMHQFEAPPWPPHDLKEWNRMRRTVWRSRFQAWRRSDVVAKTDIASTKVLDKTVDLGQNHGYKRVRVAAAKRRHAKNVKSLEKRRKMYGQIRARAVDCPHEYQNQDTTSCQEAGLSSPVRLEAAGETGPE